MRASLPILFLLIAGCSNNFHFYSPSSKAFRIDDSYRYPYTNYSLTSRSGNSLHVQVHHTTNKQRLGVVLHLHGNRGNISSTIEKVEWLLENGYDLVVFDYSGYGTSTGAPSPRNTRLDAQTLFDFVADMPQGLENYRRIVVGTSIGGTILIDGLASYSRKNVFDLVVINSAFHSYSQQAAAVVSRYPLGFLTKWLVLMVISDAYAPIKTAAGFNKAPTLFLHCEQDSVVPIEHGYKLYELVATPKAFFKLSGCRHARPITNDHPEHQVIMLYYMEDPQRMNSCVMPSMISGSRSCTDYTKTVISNIY